MTIKPWLSKNFLQMMQWSSVRDYPPKRKKPWLFDNFMEMEEIHSDHVEETFKLPNDPPLPPDPDIPQDPEDVEPDPCAGDRSLWVIANPSSVDCAVSTGFTLIISPDFRCIELTQAFFDEDGPKIVDSLGNTLEHPTNAEDIIGGLKLEKGCNDPPFITLWVSDCLCGGQTSVDISLDNCGVDCDAVGLSGPTQVLSNGTYQYEYTNFPAEGGQVQWAVAGIGATIGQDGTLFTSGACGMLTVIASSNCCGARVLNVKVVDSGVWVETNILCDTGGGTGSCFESSDSTHRRLYVWTESLDPPETSCTAYHPPPCFPGPWGNKYTVFVSDFTWQCPP